MLEPVNDVAHVIQTALTPAFLLSGIAALLNVFSTRLGRLADRVDSLTAQLASVDRQNAPALATQLSYLRLRTLYLDIAVVLGAIGAALTCVAALLLFVGSLRDTSLGAMLFTSFGLALLSTIGAVLAFVGEMLLSSRGLRAEVELREVEAEEVGR